MLFACVFCLFIISVRSDQFVRCNDECLPERDNSVGTTQTGGMRCCTDVTILDYFASDADRGIPPPLPASINAGWYVHTDKDNHKQLALNITWSDSWHISNNRTNQYKLEIMRGESSVVDKVFVRTERRSNVAGQTLSAGETVHFSYLRHGLDDYTFLDPGYGYLIYMKACPETHTSVRQDKLKTIIQLPDCDNSEVRTTENCDYEDIPIPQESHSIRGFVDDDVDVTETDSSPLIQFSVIGGMALLLILGSVCYVVYRKKKNQIVTSPADKTLFVVLSSCETKEGSMYAQVGDAISRFFMNAGLKVVYTLWSNTKIQNTNTIRWVDEQFKQADHVIMIYAPKSETGNASITRHSEWSSLLNPDFDPYAILMRSIQTRLTDMEKTSIVLCGDDKPSERSRLSVYRLPKNLSEFLKKICGKKCHVDTEQLKQQLADLTKRPGETQSISNSEENSETHEKPSSLQYANHTSYDISNSDSGYMTNTGISTDV